MSCPCPCSCSMFSIRGTDLSSTPSSSRDSGYSGYQLCRYASRAQISDEIAGRIEELIAKKATPADIAIRLRLTVYVVERFIAARKHLDQSCSPQITSARRRRILDLARQGIPITRIVVKTGHCAKTIRRVMIAAGLYKRPTGTR